MPCPRVKPALEVQVGLNSHFPVSTQHLLRVAYQDPSSGCTSKTLAVPPGASMASLAQLCATKFRVAQPDTFGLFLYKEQAYHRLSPAALAHGLPAASYLVYRRRAEQPETPGASPGAAPQEGREEPQAGARGGVEWDPGDGSVQVKSSPGDNRGESETRAKGAEEAEEAEGQDRRPPAQHRGPETRGTQAAEE